MLLKLAWRNLWRNTHRSLLTIAAMALSLIFLILTLEIYDYMMFQSVQSTLDRFTGHARLSRKGFFQEYKLNLTISVDSFPPSLAEDPRVLGYAPRLMAFALISSGEETHGVQILGIDTAAEKRATSLLSGVEGGALRAGDIPCIVAGKPVLELLGGKRGDTLFVVGTGWDGSIYARNVLVCGTFETGNPSVDASTVLMNMVSLQGILDMEGEAHYFVIRIKNSMKALQWKEEVDIPPEMVLEVWQEWLKPVWEVLKMWSVLKIVFGFIFYLAVVLIALNSFMMAFFERKREFAVVLALGMRRSLLMATVFMEGMLMGLISIGIALPVSLLISLLLHAYPIDLSGYLSTTSWEGMHIVPRVSAMLNPKNFWISAILLLILIVLTSLLVALRVRGIDTSRTLRERMI